MSERAGGCRFRYGWWTEPQTCGNVHHRRGWLFGYCVEHALGRLRWEHSDSDSDHGVFATIDLGNMHRLNWQVGDDGIDGPEWAALSWGESGCDPVWSVQVPLAGIARRAMARLFWPAEWRRPADATSPDTSGADEQAASGCVGPEIAGGRDANQGAPRPPVPPSELQ